MKFGGRKQENNLPRSEVKGVINTPVTVKKTIPLTPTGLAKLSVIPIRSYGRKAAPLSTMTRQNIAGVTTSSIDIGQSISHGRHWERVDYREQLLGVAPSGLGSGSSIASAPITGTNIPSWTKAYLGPNRNESYLVQSLSSSNHEVTQLNCFLSGTEAIENSPVSSTRSLYYSKRSSYQTLTVKLTSSQATGLYDDLNFGTLIDATASINQPLKFHFPVNQTGTLVDIKVWVEMVTLSGNLAAPSTGSAGHLVWAAVDSSASYLPLESFGISLRSPNCSWPNHWAHPIMNDPLYLASTVITGTGAQILLDTTDPQEFYRDSFLLWEPPSLSDTVFLNHIGYSDTMDSGTVVGKARQRQPHWGRDLGMRTVFYDGSSHPNPRTFQRNIAQDYQAEGAPNVSGALIAYGSGLLVVPGTGTYVHGNNAPWTSDSGSWGGYGNVMYGNATPFGSPPAGWLNGLGGVALPAEWPTTGVNYGAPTLRPLYPLLDPIYQKMEGDRPSGWIAQIFQHAQTWRGFRPGLRGTEISGSWTLMFSRPISGAQDNGEVRPTSVLPWAFVRQCRLELTYQTFRGISGFPAFSKFSRGRTPQHGEKFVALNWGSDLYSDDNMSPVSQGAFLHATYIPDNGFGSVNRSFGIAIGTGSAVSDTALEWNLTGALADISGATPGWLTNNIYGMPAIPALSWSLAPRVPVTGAIGPGPSAVFPSKLLDHPQRLVKVAQSLKPPRTLARLAAELLTGSNS